MSEIDLSLIPMEEIWTEIRKRHDACLLVTMRNVDGEHEESQVTYGGGKATCFGLAEYAKKRISQSWKSKEEPGKPDFE